MEIKIKNDPILVYHGMKVDMKEIQKRDSHLNFSKHIKVKDTGLKTP